MAKTQINAVTLGAAVLFVRISDTWRQNEQVFVEVLYNTRKS